MRENEIHKGPQTLFRRAARNHQVGRDKGVAIAGSVVLIVLGIVAALLGPTLIPFVLVRMPGLAGIYGASATRSPEAVGTFWIIFRALVIAGPVGMLAYNLMKPTKTSSCPRCRSEFRIFKAESKFMCPKCYLLILMGANSVLSPKLSRCRYCDLETGVTDDYGGFLCPNCSINRRWNDDADLLTSIACPMCAAALPAEVSYCKECHAIIEKVFCDKERLKTFDIDWEIGKNSSGHFYYAKGILESIREVAKAGAEHDIQEVEFWLTRLTTALMSIEESQQDLAIKTMAESLIPLADATYADLLNCELLLFQKTETAEKFEKDALQIFVDEPHLVPRRRLEQIFAESLETIGSIGAWEDKLIDVQDITKETIMEGTKKYRVVRSLDRLLRENERFNSWKAKTRVSSETTLTSDPHRMEELSRQTAIAKS